MWYLIPIALLALLANSRSGSAKPAFKTTGLSAKRVEEVRMVKGLAEKWAAVFGVPLPLVLAIIGNESSFNPTIETNMSTAAVQKMGGAWGLMQVTFTTGSAEIKRLKEVVKTNPAIASTLKKWHGLPSDLKDADLNVMVGTFYLGRLYRLFEGNEDATAAAYQAGPGNVMPHLKKDGDLRNISATAKKYLSMAMNNRQKFA